MADRRNNKAVTLIEMVAVLGIIVVLAGVVITLVLRIGNQSKERALDSAFGLLNTSLREYYELRDQFPWQPVQDPNFALAHINLMLEELRTVPDSRQVLDQLNPTLVKSQVGDVNVPVRDPWGNPLDYVYDSNSGDTFPELTSAGPDKRFGTADDVSNRGKRQN